MHKLFSIVSAALLFLTSCTMQEEIDLSKEGKGHYQINIDMSTMLEMAKSMGGKESIPDSMATQVKDTVISLATMIDSVGGNFTAEEKAYFQNGTMRISMNMPENKMEMTMKFPVKNARDLNNFFRVWDIVDSLNKAKKAAEPDETGNSMPNPLAGGNMGNLSSNLPFSRTPYIITDTSIEKVEQSKEEVMSDMGEQAQGLAMFMNQINMTTTIKLPRPVKKLEGKFVKLGDDKQSVFFSASMQDMMDDPKAATFKVIF